jgi:hypothetical protein
MSNLLLIIAVWSAYTFITIILISLSELFLFCIIYSKSSKRGSAIAALNQEKEMQE